MYTPMDLANKSLNIIKEDFKKFSREYAPFDIVIADIEADTPDNKILEVLKLCDGTNSNHY